MRVPFRAARIGRAGNRERETQDGGSVLGAVEAAGVGELVNPE